MGKTLIIVESPAKCKKIESYLGNNYKVIASCGHFTKLDSLDQINFDNYNIKYKIDKSKVLKQMKDEIAKASNVIIGTDDDREGEAIGWAICIFCKLNLQTTKKIVFQEITKSALTKALDNCRPINMNIVKSQQARQILDIYLGYKISPQLWKHIQNKLSAGRCQTPALKLIMDNEEEINSQSFETQYKISGHFTQDNIKFDGNPNIEKDNINEFMENMKSQQKWIICDTKESKTSEKAPNVFITSTLQQKAYNILKMTPKMTMSYAQELYENGLITYMRTDSACISKEFVDKMKKFIEEKYGEEYLKSDIYNLTKNKNKNKAQEAHEGIRVCDLNKTEVQMKNTGSNRLYKLIYNNTLMCGMADAKNDEKKYIIHCDNDYKLTYNDKICIFQGWKIIEQNNSAQSGMNYRGYLDKMYETKQGLKLICIKAEEKLKSNLLHYNEASLVNKLEKMNIGRPSTFSSIIQNLLTKKYVDKKNIEGNKMNITNYVLNTNKQIVCEQKETSLNNEKNKLKITPLGEIVCKFCFERFHELFNYDFTNMMESNLDKIENGESSQHDILSNYIQIVDKLLDQTKEYFKENPDKTKKLKENNSIYCGKIGNVTYYIKHGPYGYYVNIGKNEKISLKDFEGFDIQSKIKNQINELNQEELSCLLDYIKIGKTKKNENCLINLNADYSLRKSKYGYYIYYKTTKMKKPKFMKYNDEKDEKTEERNSWIENNNVEEIKNYICKKYNIII